MNTDIRLALLIDAENISPRYIKFILDEISKMGMSTYKRIYGDWTTPALSGWKKTLLQYAITPIQQFQNSVGKNATDSTMIIDAMDILYSCKVNGFCIASSDGDFTRLASRLREEGQEVIGFGEKKTPSAFISACTKFIYLDNLMPLPIKRKPTIGTITTPHKIEPVKEIKPETPPDEASSSIGSDKKMLISTLKSILISDGDEDGYLFEGVVGHILAKRYPDFDARNFGFDKLSKLLKSLHGFEIESRKSPTNSRIKHNYIRIKE